LKVNSTTPPDTNPIVKMFSEFRSILSVEEYNKNREKYNTYIRFGAKQTDRWIDHVFLHKQLKLERYEVVQNFLSDHLPLVFEITLPK